MQVVTPKDLVVVIKQLGIVFSYTTESVWALTQTDTIEEVLDKFGPVESAPVTVSIDGKDGDKESALNFRQSAKNLSFHTPRHSICVHQVKAIDVC